jgi:hypothetical protein
MAKNLHLHDEGIHRISMNGGTLLFEMEHFDDDLNTKVPYTIMFRGVKNLEIDHAPATDIIQPAESGEALRYKQKGNRAFFLAEWNDRSNKRRITKLCKRMTHIFPSMMRGMSMPVLAFGIRIGILHEPHLR